MDKICGNCKWFSRARNFISNGVCEIAKRKTNYKANACCHFNLREKEDETIKFKAGCEICKDRFSDAGLCNSGCDNFPPVDVKEPVNDDINHPNHYKQGKIEVLDFIEDMPCCEANIIKYVARYKHKGQPLKDLLKAEFYLKRLIKKQEVTK